MSPEIIGKLDRGDGLTDDELDKALEFYGRLEADLRMLGRDYRLAWIPVSQRLRDLKGFRAARVASRAANAE